MLLRQGKAQNCAGHRRGCLEFLCEKVHVARVVQLERDDGDSLTIAAQRRQLGPAGIEIDLQLLQQPVDMVSRIGHGEAARR